MGIKNAPPVRGEGAACGCRCIRCKSRDLTSLRVGPVESDGYYDMHHTCGSCGAHFDHLEGVVFDACDACGYGVRGTRAASAGEGGSAAGGGAQ